MVGWLAGCLPTLRGWQRFVGCSTRGSWTGWALIVSYWLVEMDPKKMHRFLDFACETLHIFQKTLFRLWLILYMGRQPSGVGWRLFPYLKCGSGDPNPSKNQGIMGGDFKHDLYLFVAGKTTCRAAHKYMCKTRSQRLKFVTFLRAKWFTHIPQEIKNVKCLAWS